MFHETPVRQTRLRRGDFGRDLWMLALSVFIVVLLVKLDAASTDAKHAGDAAKMQAISTQEQRIETIGQSCEDQNMRLDGSILATAHAVGIKATAVTPRLLRELKRNHKVQLFVTILEAITPRKDCRQVVFNATGYDPANPKTIPGGPSP